MHPMQRTGAIALATLLLAACGAAPGPAVDASVAAPGTMAVDGAPAAGDADAPALYLHVRRGCEARLNRSTYEQLAQIALSEAKPGADEDWTVTSGGQTFSLLPAA